MDYVISDRYDAEVLCEISVNVDGYNFLVIYGSHANGYFCCIPNWAIGCEMADASDTFYNAERLARAKIPKRCAKPIAQAIAQTVCGPTDNNG